MKIQRSEHLSVERSDYGIEMEIKQKEEQGITELPGGEKSVGGKRDGLNQTRQELTARPTGTPSVHLN